MAKSAGGVRGGSSARSLLKRQIAQAASPQRARSSKQSRESRTIALVQQQYGINLNDYRTDRTRSFGGRRGIQVDWNAMSQNVKNAITRLSNRPYSTFTILDNGAGMKLLKFK